MPTLYIIAGPNGAGKTTFATTFLPKYEGCTEFVNADMIAKGLSPFDPERVALQAGRLMLERVRALIEAGSSFALETTLSGKTYVRILRDAKARGYTVRLVYLWVPDPEVSIQRVADRVRRGGHHIPEEVIRRRFNRGLWNLFHIYAPVVDSWAIMDNSGAAPRMVAAAKAEKIEVYDANLFERIKKQADQS